MQFALFLRSYTERVIFVEIMHDVFYSCLMRIAGITGPWFFKAMAWCVATGYILCSALAGLR
jgi:hypothetical protein